MAKEPDDMDDFGSLDDLDLDKLDSELDAGSLFDDDIPGSKVPGKRNPVTEFGKGVADSVKGLKISVPALADDIDRAFPKTSNLFQQATGTVSDMMSIKNEVMKDLSPTINQLKQTTRRLMPRMEGVLPKKVYQKVYDKLAPDTTSPASQSEMRDEIIAQQLEAVFSAQQAQDSEDKKQDRTDRYIERALTKADHDDSMGAMSSMKKSLFLMNRFNQTTLKGYLKKSLELKYRHLFIAQDSLAITKTMAASLDDKLKSIAHNTALPDYQKKYKSEAVAEHTRQLLMGNVSSTIGDWSANFRERTMANVKKLIKEKISGLSDNASMMADGLDQYAEMAEMEKDMGIKQDSLAKGAGKMAGSYLLTKGAKGLLGKAINKFKQHGIDIENMSESIKTKAMYYIKDKANADENDIWTFLGDNIFPRIKDERGESRKMLAKSALDEIPFDVLTRRSIVEIIPGFLGMIAKNTADIATGTDTPEMVFDIDKEDFVTKKRFKASLGDKYFGNKELRTQEIGESIGKMFGAYKKHGGKEDKFYDSMEDVVKFVNNSVKHLQLIDPKKIANIIKGEDVDDRYNHLAFMDVKDKEGLLEVLQTVLFKDGDKEDTSVKHTLNILNERLSRVRDERLVPRLAKTGALGTRRLHEEFFNEKGQLDHSKVRAKYADVDLASMKDRMERESETYKDQLTKEEERRSRERNFESETPEDAPASTLKDRILIQLQKNKDVRYTLHNPLRKEKPEEYIARRIRQKLKREHIVLTEQMKEKIGDIVGTLGSKYDHMTTNELKLVSTEFIETLLEKLKDTKQDIADTPVKDVAHVSGPGVYVQASKEEMHIPLDDIKAKYWVNLGTTITNSILKVKNGANNKAIDDDASTNDILREMYALLTTFPEAMRFGHFGGFKKVLKGAGGIIGKTFNYGLDINKSIWKGAGRLASGVADMLPGLGEAAGNMASGIGTGIGRMTAGMGSATGSMFRGIGSFFGAGFDNDEFTTDIYSKAKGPKKPVITLAQLRKGVRTASGKLIKRLKDIVEPIYDMETGELLVSQEDIDAGLITATGELISSLTKKGKSLAGKLGRTLGSAGKNIWNLGVKGVSSGLDIGGNLSMLGMDALRGMGTLASGLFKKTFGMDGSGILNKKHVNDLITKRLDAIFDLLNERLEKPVKGDTDRDGDREGSYEDYLQDRRDAKAKREAGVLGTVKRTGSRMASGFGALGAAFGMGKSDVPGSEDSTDGEEPGVIKTAAATAGATYLTTKFPAIAKKLGSIKNAIRHPLSTIKGVGKIFGSKTGSTAATKAASSILSKSALKSIGTKIPILSTILGTAFAANYARKGEWTNSALAMAAGLVANIPGYGTAASLALDGILLGRELSETGDTHEGLKEDITKPVRMQVYRAPQILEESILRLEMWTKQALDRQEPLDTDTIRSIVNWFNLDPGKEEQVSYFYTWYKERFLRAFTIFRTLAQALKVDIHTVSRLDKDQQVKLAKAFKEQAEKMISLDLRFIPSQIGFISYMNSKTLNITPYKSQQLDTPKIAEKLSTNKTSLSDHELASMGILYKELGGIPEVTLTHNDIDHIFALRLKGYGVYDKKDTHDAIYALEEWSKLDRTSTSDKFTRHRSEDIADQMIWFGLDKNIPKQRQFFIAWYRQRFYPILSIGRTLADQMGTSLEDAPSLPEDDKVMFIKSYVAAIKKVQCDTTLIPTMEAYEGYKTTHKDPDKIQEPKKSFFEKAKDLVSSAGSKIKGALKGPSRTPVEDDGTLGWISRQHESGSAGSNAIGYDRKGGTSYGKYQLSSKAGTFDAFLDWVEEQPGGAEVANRLRAAGSADTGSKIGNVPAEWKKLVKEGKLGQLEHDFIKLTHFDKALDLIQNKELKDRIHNSKVLQEALWSTSVQHGPGKGIGAAGIFEKAYKSGMTDEELITAVYNERSTKFGSSTAGVQASVMNRFKEESSTLIAKAKINDNLKNDVIAQNMTDKTIDKVVSTYKEQNTVDPISDYKVVDRTVTPTIIPESKKLVDPKDTSSNINVVAKVEPDVEQRKLATAQYEELRTMNSHMERFVTTMTDTFSKGGLMDEMTSHKKNLQAAAPTIVQIDARQMASLTNNQSNTQGIDLRKRA